MRIWQQDISVAKLTRDNLNTATSHLGIEFLEVGDDFITARPVHIGRSTQVWQIDMVNEAGEPTCVSRITMAVLAPK